MGRSNATDYAGARSRLTLDKAARLDRRRHAIQPKIDGEYARVHLDEQGRVERCYYRTGRQIPARSCGWLLGRCIGAPGAELVGEIELGTEWARRQRELRGRPMLHLFDCLRADGRYLGHAPYRERRDALQRSYGLAVEAQLGRETIPTPHGRRDRDGRWAELDLRDWEYATVVEQRPIAHADQLWSDYVERGGEGLVVVALDAPIGKRSAKRKIKATDTIDALVVEAHTGVLRLSWAGHSFLVGRPRRADVTVGSVVEVKHDGWYESSVTPRFPRVVRVREDLRAARA